MRAHCFYLTLILYLSVFQGYGQQTPRLRSLGKEEFKRFNNQALSFYVFGDWGRDGKFGQKKVSKAMKRAARFIKPKFILSTGDNFYPDGVRSVNDVQWKTSFENIYKGKSLFCPWYVVLGNHDYQISPEAEIAYSEKSNRWKMPARYYSKSFQLKVDSSVADFFFIDTSPLQNEYYTDEEGRKLYSGQDTTRQLHWLDSALNASHAKWKWVVGHHPLYTGGPRADDVPYVRRHLEKIFNAHHVNAYLCGHEHSLQHIESEEGTHNFISGAGSELTEVQNLASTKFAKAANGFMIFSITSVFTNVMVVDTEGRVIYRVKIFY